ncbi:NAD(P)-dependent oxidoreductase [Brachybacterium sp. YJGR34]|uniref:NAD(P)-dependent oxidoreductase n=1 Tax=Brachybacterium sp. YJGR34 TaxID=2059911 RepID=UPI0013009D9A|nr:NAD(P)H-binding protein [Brachybacterium sp. YJGR34]
MHIVVAGATGATGSLVLERALTAGHRVTALVRDASAAQLPPGVEVQQAQVVTDPDLTLPADTDAVISALGSRTPKDPQPVCAPGTAHLVEALGRLGGRRRLVVVSASPVHTTGAGEPWWFRYIARPLVRRVGGPLYDDIAAMEDVVRAAGPDCAWTIVRPGYLVDAGPTSYELLPERNASTSACRIDLADALVTLAADDGAAGRSFGLTRGTAR